MSQSALQTAPPNGASVASTNPATGKTVARFALHDAVGVEATLDSCAAAQRQWARTPLDSRLRHLEAVAGRLDAQKHELARLVTSEMGKPLSEALGEIEKCAWVCRYYADKAPEFLAGPVLDTEQARNRIVFEPLGVVLAIMPWNYPFWQFFRFAAPALAAGNGVLLKHAADVPGCADAIERLMRNSGLPADLVRNLFIEPRNVAELLADNRVAAVTFTGSTEVGGIVAAQAARHIKKQVLELGGSDALLVLADADIEAAAAAAAQSRFGNCGQSCISAKRIIVEEAVADAFLAALGRQVDRLTLGDPLDEATKLGPMARNSLRSTLHAQLVDSVAAGARLVRGGDIPDGPGNFYAPAILDHVRPGMRAFDEETFGPLAAVVRARDAADAVRLANLSEFGLGAAVWTSDPQKAESVAAQLEAGFVAVNRIVASDPRLPFGGSKKSGYGRELGAYGMHEFTNVKTIAVART